MASPGRLPNGITVEGMRIGARAARKDLLKDVMRDYGYLEQHPGHQHPCHRFASGVGPRIASGPGPRVGLGVPRKIVALMRAWNGTDPDFIEGVESLTVVLHRGAPPPPPK